MGAPDESGIQRNAHTTPGLKAREVEADGTLPPGCTVGEYRVTGKISRGGMGTVYAALHPVIGKKVAIKVLNHELSRDPTMVVRFIQEARAVNKIGHRNIVDIFAFGQLDNGLHYYVMDLLEGTSLRHRLAAEPRMSYRDAIHVISCVCEALAAAHAHGIVHRDLKPDNIFVCDEKTSRPAEIKLLDFGIAKLLDQVGGDNTNTGTPMGTPRYMSPEQARGRPIDHRCDIYAMGVICFEVFSGDVPFPGSAFLDIVNQHADTPPPRPELGNPELPGAMGDVILKCLQKAPQDRFQTATELARALDAAAAGLHERIVPPSRRPPPPKEERSDRTPEATAATQNIGPSAPGATPNSRPVNEAFQRLDELQRSRSRPTRSRWPVALVAAGLLVAGVVGWYSYRGGRPADPSASAAATANAAPAISAPGITAPAIAPPAVLAPRRSSLQVRVDAPAAIFTLDGTRQAAGTSVLEREVEPGKHTVRVEAPGRLPREETLEVRAGETLRAEWTLSLEPASTSPKPTTNTKPTRPRDLPDAPKSQFRLP